MNYYKLMYDYEKAEQAILLHIDEKELEFDRYDVNSNKELGVQKIYCMIEEENVSNYDYLANNLAWLIVSGRTKILIERYNIGECEFILVVNKKNEEPMGYLVHCMNILDALDEEKSLCKKMKYLNNGREYERMSVIKYAIDPSKVDDMDIFKLKKSDIPYFVSERIRIAILDSGIKGFDFMKIQVS